jgi:hypothetical protein
VTFAHVAGFPVEESIGSVAPLVTLIADLRARRRSDM